MATSAQVSREKAANVCQRRRRSIEVVIACFFCMALSSGTGSSMSLLVAELLRYFRESKFAISWFNGICLAVANASALVWMVALRRLSHRSILLIGIVTTCLGQLSAAFSTHVYHLYISLGLMTGIGFGAMDYVSASKSGEYFGQNGYLAIGIVSSGSAVANTLLPVLLNFLIEVYTWRGALIILGATTIQVAPLVCVMTTNNASSTRLYKQTKRLENAFLSNGEDDTFLELDEERCIKVDIDEEIMDIDGFAQEKCSPEDVEVVAHLRKTQGTAIYEYCIDPVNAIPTVRENVVYLLGTFRFYSLSLSILLSALCCNTFLTFNMDFYLHRGFSNADSAAMLLYVGIGNVFARLMACVVSQRLEKRRCVILLTATLLLVIGNALLLLFNNIWVYRVVAFIFGSAHGCVGIGAVIGCLEQCTTARYREGLAMITVVFGLGMMIGPPIGGLVFDLTQDYSPVFMVCLGISMISAVAILPVVCFRPPNPSYVHAHRHTHNR